MPHRSLAACCLAEVLGTFLLVFLGCGAVHVAVLTDGLSGLWQVGVVWGVAIMLAAFTIGGISGAHINPAITIALACWRQFSWPRVVPYIGAQLVGAFLAAGMLFALFDGFLVQKELQKKVRRGQPGSEITAMCYCEYFPNPGDLAKGDEKLPAGSLQKMEKLVSPSTAFLAEAFGTAILAFVVVMVSNPNNADGPKWLAPVFIGLTVTALICVIAPLTQACFNPARDFGPRLFASLAGWGSVALPGPRGMGFLTVYILAPICGAIVGAGVGRRVGGNYRASSE